MDLHVHLVWTTKLRASTIESVVQAWMWQALAEKCRDVGSQFVVVGGMPDHVHVLTQLPPTVSVAELARRLKGASSRIAHLKGLDVFAWEEVYGASSVSAEQFAAVARYVRDQPDTTVRGPPITTRNQKAAW